MITQRQRLAIKKILGKGYSKKIVTYLESQSIRNSRGEPYTETYVLVVMSGRPNESLEAAIYQAVAHYKELYRKEEELKEKILQPYSEIEKDNPNFLRLYKEYY